MVALQLLWERAQGDKSPIAPWIAVLPAPGELDIPLFWGKEDLALADASSTRVRQCLNVSVPNNRKCKNDKYTLIWHCLLLNIPSVLSNRVRGEKAR